MSYQDLQLVKGSRDAPLMTSLILVFGTVASWDTLKRTHATLLETTGGALWLPKSEGTFAELVRWQMDT